MGERRREGHTKLYYLWFLHIIYTVDKNVICFFWLKCWILHLGIDTLAFLCSIYLLFAMYVFTFSVIRQFEEKDENTSVFLLSFKCLSFFSFWCFIYQMSLLVIIYHYYLYACSFFFLFYNDYHFLLYSGEWFHQIEQTSVWMFPEW